MFEPGGPTLGDWAAVIAAGAALLSLLAALLAWRAPRGVGPAVGWDAQLIRGAPTGGTRESIIQGVIVARRDPDLIQIRNTGWRTAFDVDVKTDRGQVRCDRVDPNSGLVVRPGDIDAVTVTWSPSHRWPGSKQRRTWRSPPLA